MKTTFFFACASMIAATVGAQVTPAPNRSSEPAQQPKEFRAKTEARVKTPAEHKVTYSGALVQAARSGKPAQMINPLAPARYGSGLENIAIDPITGRAQGIRLFAITF